MIGAARNVEVLFQTDAVCFSLFFFCQKRMPSLQTIDAHFNERLTCRSVAEKFSYHPNYVNRIVRELTGWSLHEYIIHVKVHHASQLLMETDMSITDIAYYLGFHDSSHFSSVYQMRTGMKPSELRKNQNGDPCKKERDLIT